MTSEELSSPSGLVSPSTASSSQAIENIKVAIRLRPFTEKERQRNNRRIVDIQQNTVALYNANNSDTAFKKFTFDYSYWSHDGFRKDTNGVNIPDPAHANSEKYISQEKVFEDLGKFLLINALEGYDSALLAYGQTGSGKSYTVSGYGHNEGILPRFARALYEELDKKALVLNGPSLRSPIKDNDNINNNDDKAEIKQREGEQEFEANQKGNYRYEVMFSMLEIYNEVVRDLLAKTNGDLMVQSAITRGLKVREHPKHGFFVENLTSYACADKGEIEQKIEEGHLSKSIAATSMNETSSRGHTIYEFRIKQYKLKSLDSATETLTTSVVQLVDLAGSERMAVHVTGQMGSDSFIGSRSSSPYFVGGRMTSEKLPPLKTNNRTKVPTSATPTASTSQVTSSPSSGGGLPSRRINGQNNNLSFLVNHQQRFKESVSINQSLSALGNCIQVMSQYSQQFDSNGHNKRPWPKIPYRDSVLTRLLNRCCLSGTSKVVIIATLSPADANYEDTLSTLRFADRAKQIRTHAKVNQMNRHTEMSEYLQKENQRLKQLVDGRVTRSDDSSQTSNFDETENAQDNFSGSKIIGKANSNIDVMATPMRSRTTVRRPRERKASKSQRRVADKKATTVSSVNKLTSSSSNPSLAVNEQMKRLVSPASRKLAVNDREELGGLHKSRSMNHGLSNLKKQSSKRMIDYKLDDLDLNELENAEALEEIDLNDLADIKEGLISPDSDESISALADGDLTNEEKIKIFNKLLSNSNAANEATSKLQRTGDKKSPTKRPRKANSSTRAGIRQVSVLSSTLKKSNPYLSNLNPDEQLTGKISYIIKQGETLIGKDNDCDIVLHGPDLRYRHAKLTSLNQNTNPNDDEKLTDGDEKEKDRFNESSRMVFIEPLLDNPEEVANIAQKDLEKKVALMINGLPVIQKTRLKHCDRVLFGTNAYFVFADNTSIEGLGQTVADLDLVTFDMARAEVLKKVMAEAKNEAMIKEINDYTHRPGTGKNKEKLDRNAKKASLKLSKDGDSRLTRSITIHDQEGLHDQIDPNETALKQESKGAEEASQILNNNVDLSDDSNTGTSDATYRDQLMQDTYEYAMPVAEVNAVAKEMNIKVVYGLKILTGEERMPDQLSLNHLDSDGYSSSSLGEIDSSDEMKVKQESRINLVDDRVTYLKKLDFLDIPPALFIRVHLEELGLNFYWSKEKFQANRFKILELYGAWDVGGKSGLVEYLIDQSRLQRNYLFDPFVDDPNSTLVFIGHAQITLKPISHLANMKESYSILDVDDETVGNIIIEAIPCHNEEVKVSEAEGGTNAPFRPYNEEDLAKNLLDNPTKLLNKKLVFLLKIVACQDMLEKYTNIFCQYRLNLNGPIVRTRILNDETMQNKNSDDGKQELLFDHSHFICIDKTNQDLLDFLEHGFLTIQVVGQYKLIGNLNRPPTVVSTIINSINKYKIKIEQQSSFSAMNHSSSTYYNSNSNSIKSQRASTSGGVNSNSGASSVVSTSATVNLFDQQNDDDEGSNSTNGLSQENIIDMILTKRKLDRAENQLVSD